MSQHVSELKDEILDLRVQLADLRSKQDEDRSYVERMDETEFQQRLAVSLNVLLRIQSILEVILCSDFLL